MAKKSTTKPEKKTTTVTTPADKEPVKKKRAVAPKAGATMTIADTGSDDLANLRNRAELTGTTTTILSSLLASKMHSSAGFKPLSEVRQEFIPFPHMSVQYALGTYGFPQQRVIELIGPEATAKTQLAFEIMGCNMKYCSGYAGLYLSCENKHPTPERVARSLHTDPVKAALMAKGIIIKPTYSLAEMADYLEHFAKVIRGKVAVDGQSVAIPMHVPVMYIVDPITRLMSKEEEVGFYDYGDNMKKDTKGATPKRKATGESGTFGHAKFHQQMFRRYASLHDEYNLVGIFVSHQNDKVDMSGGGFSVIPADVAALFNKTKNGGKALNQAAATQLIFAPSGLVKNTANEAVGRKIKVRVEKNSYGPPDRKFEFTIRTSDFEDSEAYLEPALDYSEGLAKLFADKKILGTTVTSKRYTCKEIGAYQVTHKEFEEALYAHPDVMSAVGTQLNISGYTNLVELAVADAAKHTAADLPEVSGTTPAPPPPLPLSIEDEDGDDFTEDSQGDY